MKYNVGRFKEDYSYIIIIFIIILLINRNLLLNMYDPPTGVDMLGWIDASSYLSNNTNFLYSWLDYSFGVSGALSQAYVLFSVMNMLIQNPVITVKIYILIAFLVSGISMYAVTYFFTSNRISGLISALIFILNPLFIGLVGSGQLNTVLIFFLGPIYFLSFYVSIEKKDKYFIIIFSFVTVYMLIARLDQFLYYGSFLIFYCIFIILISKETKKTISDILHVLLISTISTLGLGMIFFLPIIMGTSPPYLGVRTLTVQRLEWYSSDISETLLGIPAKSFTPIISSVHFPTVTTDALHYNPSYIIIPIFFVYSAILFKRNSLTIFLTISALLYSIFATGSRPPFGGIYSWMWLNIPFFQIFSIPSRWLIITYLSYSILIGVTIDEILKMSQKGYINKNLITFLIIILICSIFLGNWFAIGKGLQTWKFPKDEVDMYKFLYNQSDNSRVIPIPFVQETMMTKFGLLRDLGFESSLFHGKETVRTGEGVRYSRDITNYWDNLILTNKTNNIPKILGRFDIKYITLSDRPVTWKNREVDPEYQNIFFRNQKGLKPIYVFNNTTIYENEYWTPRVSVSSRQAIIIGGREFFATMANIDEFNFKDWTLFFSDQVIRENGDNVFINLLDKSDMIIFFNSELLDVAISMLNDSVIIRPGEYGYPSTNTRDNWISSDAKINMGKFILNSKTLYTTRPNNISIPVKLIDDGNYDIWIRIVYYNNVGMLNLSIDGQEIEGIIPYSTNMGIKWTKLGNANLHKGKHVLLFQNKKSIYGTTNDIDEIIFVEPDEIATKLSEINEMIRNRKVIFIRSNNLFEDLHLLDFKQGIKDNMSIYYSRDNDTINFLDDFKVKDDPIMINFTKINPTKYTVKVNSRKPFLLTLSNSYHPMWKAYANNEKIDPIISYSFVNSYYINKTGDIDIRIEFIGQKYVWIGGIISIISLIFVIYALSKKSSFLL